MPNEYSLRFVAAFMLALLILAPALDGAPVLQSLKGDQKLADSWTSGPVDRDTTPHRGLSELLDETISSPTHLDKILAAALKTAETNSELRRMSGQSYEMDDATSLSRKARTETVTRRTEDAILTSKQKFMKMLNAMEKLHKNLNSHLTIISKGNNFRSSAKKSKTTVTDGGMKPTTMSTVLNGGTSPRVSTDQLDPKHLTGRAFKKSLPSTPKKTNKRVCFWKYCSQN